MLIVAISGYGQAENFVPISLPRRLASMRANRASTALECSAHNIVPLRIAHRRPRAP
jgi:hypothetical protein